VRNLQVSQVLTEGNFNPQQMDVSMMVFPSLETTHKSEKEVFYNSMILENNCFNKSNTSFDCSLYRPNVGNIPLRTLKDFPFLLQPKIEDLVYCSKKQYNKFDDRNNKTFMMTSFDKLSTSATSDNNNYRHRKFKRHIKVHNKMKQKNSKFKWNDNNKHPTIYYNKFDLMPTNVNYSFENKRQRERSNSDYNNFFPSHSNITYDGVQMHYNSGYKQNNYNLNNS